MSPHLLNISWTSSSPTAVIRKNLYLRMVGIRKISSDEFNIPNGKLPTNTPLFLSYSLTADNVTRKRWFSNDSPLSCNACLASATVLNRTYTWRGGWFSASKFLIKAIFFGIFAAFGFIPLIHMRSTSPYWLTSLRNLFLLNSGGRFPKNKVLRRRESSSSEDGECFLSSVVRFLPLWMILN